MATILLADDDIQLRTMLREILEIENYHVIEVGDGEKTINFLKNNPVDIVITDLIMPKKEGIETINELRKLYPDLPIIAMSGGSMTNSRVYLDIALKLGVIKAFLKPFDINEMLETIHSVITNNP
jgi:DNA-binding response OmpR family regulator